jgi:MFS transporter, SHS family, lactate transporter
VLIILFRYTLPETNAFQVMRAEREAALEGGLDVKGRGARAWLKEVWAAIKPNWFLFVYMIFLMTGFNSCSHGSQDLYPTFLKNRKSTH